MKRTELISIAHQCSLSGCETKFTRRWLGTSVFLCPEHWGKREAQALVGDLKLALRNFLKHNYPHPDRGLYTEARALLEVLEARA